MACGPGRNRPRRRYRPTNPEGGADAASGNGDPVAFLPGGGDGGRFLLFSARSAGPAPGWVRVHAVAAGNLYSGILPVLDVLRAGCDAQPLPGPCAGRPPAAAMTAQGAPLVAFLGAGRHGLQADRVENHDFS